MNWPVRMTNSSVKCIALAFCCGCSWHVFAEDAQKQPIPVLNTSANMQKQLDLINGLSLGFQREAMPEVLRSGKRRAERVEVATFPRCRHSLEYDRYERWRLWGVVSQRSVQFSQDLWLFYRDGFLFRKCLTASTEVCDHRTVYCREILSGRQHPPADAELMKHVKWGKPQDPLEESDEPGITQLRCGVVLDGRTVFAREHGYNVLVLLQNVGCTPLDDEIWIDMWSGPQFRLTVNGKQEEDLSITQYWGASPVRRRSDVISALLDSAGARQQVSDSERDKLVKRGAGVATFRLEPSECLYAWFRVPELPKRESLKAEAAATGVLGGYRQWKAQSELLQIRELEQ